MNTQKVATVVVVSYAALSLGLAVLYTFGAASGAHYGAFAAPAWFVAAFAGAWAFSMFWHGEATEGLSGFMGVSGLFGLILNIVFWVNGASPWSPWAAHVGLCVLAIVGGLLVAVSGVWNWE